MRECQHVQAGCEINVMLVCIPTVSDITKITWRWTIGPFQMWRQNLWTGGRNKRISALLEWSLWYSPAMSIDPHCPVLQFSCYVLVSSQRTDWIQDAICSFGEKCHSLGNEKLCCDHLSIRYKGLSLAMDTQVWDTWHVSIAFNIYSHVQVRIQKSGETPACSCISNVGTRRNRIDVLPNGDGFWLCGVTPDRYILAWRPAERSDSLVVSRSLKAVLSPTDRNVVCPWFRISLIQLVL